MDNIAVKSRAAHHQPTPISGCMGITRTSSGVVMQRRSYHCRERVREDYLLALTLDGNAWVRQENRRRELAAGDWFLLEPHLAHEYCNVGSWSLAWVHFSGPVCDDLVSALDLAGAGHLCFQQHGRSTRDLLLRIVLEHDDGSTACEAHKNALLLELLALLRQHYTCAGKAEDKGVVLTASYIAEHLLDEFNLDDLAAMAHLSRFHFLRLFKQRYGTPPMTFRQKLRIESARNLMQDHPDLPIAEIALRTGFNDPLYFSRTFRRWTGMSPSTFLQQVREDAR